MFSRYDKSKLIKKLNEVGNLAINRKINIRGV